MKYFINVKRTFKDFSTSIVKIDLGDNLSAAKAKVFVLGLNKNDIKSTN